MRKTISQLCKECGVHRTALNKAIDRDAFPAEKSGDIWLIDDETAEFQAWLNDSNGGRPRNNGSLQTVLRNHCEIARGHGAEVGLMQTEKRGKPEAYLMWLEGQSLTSERAWRFCDRAAAVAQINEWLGNIGLALQDGKIVEF